MISMFSREKYLDCRKGKMLPAKPKKYHWNEHLMLRSWNVMSHKCDDTLITADSFYRLPEQRYFAICKWAVDVSRRLYCHLWSIARKRSWIDCKYRMSWWHYRNVQVCHRTRRVLLFKRQWYADGLYTLSSPSCRLFRHALRIWWRVHTKMSQYVRTDRNLSFVGARKRSMGIYVVCMRNRLWQIPLLPKSSALKRYKSGNHNLNLCFSLFFNQ